MNFLYDRRGKRKYLTINERRDFLYTASKCPKEIHTFCATLAYTGARISEILALTPEHVDFTDRSIVIECLKKRHQGAYRFVPVPLELLKLLDQVHHIRDSQRHAARARERLWSWCRTTAWKHVKCTMHTTGIVGIQACPKGLRHSFGVSALQKQVPLTMVRKWLGHSRLSTTAIYADAIGDEERAIASRFWSTFN